MPRTNKSGTTDAVEILRRDLIGDDSRQATEYEQVRADLAVARKIYHLRSSAGLTQGQLAKLIGTSRTVICRLEDADYEGHSMALLSRVAAALHQRVEIRFVPLVVRGEATSAVAKRKTPVPRPRRLAASN